MSQLVIKKNPNITTVFPHGQSQPFCILIIRSGWVGRYHVICEWGDTGETTHRLMKAIEVLDVYNLDGNDLPERDVHCVTKEDILNHPNDADLGEYIRKKIYDN